MEEAHVPSFNKTSLDSMSTKPFVHLQWVTKLKANITNYTIILACFVFNIFTVKLSGIFFFFSFFFLN